MIIKGKESSIYFAFPYLWTIYSNQMHLVDEGKFFFVKESQLINPEVID